MFCQKCGDPIESNEKFCNKCGNQVGFSPNMQQKNQNISTFNNNQLNYNNQNYNNQNYNNQNYNNQNYNNQNYNNQYNINNQNNKKEQMKMIFIGAGAGFGILLVVFVCILLVGNKNYYFSENSNEDNEEIVSNQGSNSTQNAQNPHKTVIVTDNVYEGVKISDSSDAIELIQKDSTSQKDQCPVEIKEVEEQLIRDYNITAVNLCELDLEFAKEIVKVFDVVYKEYPSARGYLTNLSLTNASISEGYIAVFISFFQFATANSESGYPWVYKTQILLNTKFYLNLDRLESSVVDGSNSGHFPPNATKYSPIAHELAHYLSFLARMHNYDLESMLLVDESNVFELYDFYEDTKYRKFSLLMLEEAYNNYQKDVGTTLSFDDWRATISGYAVAKDNEGNYLYDETIAEAFHDVYLNGDNAVDASKYVVSVLKSKLEGR